MMYQITIPPMLRGLGAMSAILAKAEAHCQARKIDPAVLAADRLYPDMFPLNRQVQLACDFAARSAARLTGAEVPSFPDVETTLPQLRDRIAATRAYLETFGEPAFAEAAERPVTIKLAGQDMTFPGVVYLTNVILPQFYFHTTTTYAILRHNGVEIGKRDFMGAA